MKALVFKKYGVPSEVLRLEERPKPAPAAHEVLVKVRATAVNDYDWSMVQGKPYLYRLLFGLRKPSRQVPGMEVSGTVEALGKNISALEVGDAVYGDISEYSFGTFAEYACVHEKALARKPAGMFFEEAAAIPHASLLAYQGLVGMGGIQQGQQVLINGAGGGVGAFGLQLAKLYDAEVTGVDAGEKLERMKSAGF
ncbi:MAG: NAD(P)-dependent alcohol dehydrogenase, partial [Phaeodactylibacter sp.]|nr:NAD(P)-dependent alcohol dehydrogenase [Phaeodactylibacter sp.]